MRVLFINIFQTSNFFSIFQDTTHVQCAEEALPDVDIRPITEDNDFKVDGRRVIDVMFFFSQLQMISHHNSPFECNFNNLKLIEESRKGLFSRFTFKCMMCNQILNIDNCEKVNQETKMTVNQSFVSGIMSVGLGFSALEELLSVAEISTMSNRIYAKCHKKVCEWWERAKATSMAEAALEESKLALERGEVNQNGIPMITVVADGCWSKRSYGKNYAALSGAAAIVGYRTKKVIFMAVKNKYCTICARADNKNIKPSEHVCFKNYVGSSSGMESVAILEGFKSSLDMYGIIYSKLIADGDSSTYKKIIDAHPYANLVVEKIECSNHLLRNYCTRIDQLARDTHYPLVLRKQLSSGKLRLRFAVSAAIKYRKDEMNKTFDQKVFALKADISNAPYHVFGDHTKCDAYFCKFKNGTESESIKNYVPALKSSLMFEKLLQINSRLVMNAKSLIHKVHSNSAESFNGIISKFVGGKRINFSLRQSYSARCAAAVVSYNTKQPHTFFSRKIFGFSPKNLKKLEQRKAAKLSAIRVWKKRALQFSATKLNNPDYGEGCQRPDIEERDMENEKKKYLDKLRITDEERRQIERRTILQADCQEWLEKRRRLITSSNFGIICKRKVIKCGNLVKSLLYGSQLDHIKSIKYGREHEHMAITQLGEQEGFVIEKCGLFLDKEYGFLGASPDGQYENDLLIEIKCPFSAAGMVFEDAIKLKKITFWKMCGNELVLNKSHNWYYQVQGQLHVTGRSQCLFAIWFGSNIPLKTELIEKDDLFWENYMKDKLINFFVDCLLPEIIDPRINRNMEVREPSYILDAIRARETSNKKRKRHDTS